MFRFDGLKPASIVMISEWWEYLFFGTMFVLICITSENPFGLGYLFPQIRRRYWRRACRRGTRLSHTIACDIRREVEVVDVGRIMEGIVSARVRTTNVLYMHSGLIDPPEFEPVREWHIDEIWHWTGQPWGGLADGTSLVDPRHGAKSKRDAE